MSLGAILTAMEEDTGLSSGTPLDYGSNLLFFVETTTGVTQGGPGSGGLNQVTSWADQSDNSLVFSVPATDARPPEFEPNSIVVPDGPNIDGITFQESPTAQDRKLSNGGLDQDEVLDSIFSGGSQFDRTFGFAARIDTLDSSNTSEDNTLFDKGFFFSNGFALYQPA